MGAMAEAAMESERRLAAASTWLIIQKKEPTAKPTKYFSLINSL